MIGYGPPGGIGEIGRPTVRSSGPVMIVVNNADSGYVKALQHATYGGRYQSSDLAETNYAKVAEAMGCLGLRVEDPEEFAPAVERGIAETGRPTVVDVVVTRDPAKMLPGVDSRTAPVIKKGDRIA